MRKTFVAVAVLVVFAFSANSEEQPKENPHVTELLKQGQAAETDAQWKAFVRKYKAEMTEPHARHDLALLAAMSHDANFSVGCYCENEDRCHRSVLRTLLEEAGAIMVNG